MSGGDFQGEALSWSCDAEGIAELRLHRPPLNELGEQSLSELEGFAQAASAGAFRGLLLRSELPRGFCAGADLRALAQAFASRPAAEVLDEARSFLTRINAVLTQIDLAPCPTVGALHGVVFGGGFELALCCDLLVAARSTRFAFPELRLGLIPGFGGLARLERELGQSRLRDLLFTGRSLNAERAREAGLVSQVVAPGKEVKLARAALSQVLRLPQAALRATKARLKVRAPLQAQIEADQARFLELLARPEAAAALASFAEREDLFPYLPAKGSSAEGKKLDSKRSAQA